MRRLQFILLSFSIVLSLSFGDQKEEFDILLDSASLELVIPHGFVETDVIENRDQMYQYAVKNSKLGVEIRYRIWVYDDVLKMIDESSPEFKEGQMWAILGNMTHGKSRDFMEYPKEAVGEEFNADWGATQSVELDCDFGKGYKYCTITTIHKNSLADAYIFYLYDDPNMAQAQLNDTSNNWFYTLKFKATK